MLAVLTPKPFRGDVIAAGVVVLVTLVWTLLLRFDTAWSPVAHVSYCLVAFAFVGAMAVLAPMESDKPRAYQSVLYLATIALWIAVLTALILEVGVDTPEDLLHDITGALVLIAFLAFGFAVLYNSAACTLVGAIASGLATIGAVEWIASPDSVTTFRWVLLCEAVCFGIAAIGHRDRRPRHAVALVNAAGIAVLVIGLTFATWTTTSTTVSGVGALAGSSNFSVAEVRSVPWGWELLIVATGFGLVAYSSVDRQPGPAYIGLANLILFTMLTSLGIVHATLVGWPLALAVAAAFLLIVGLRPTTPAPPPPDIDAPEPPPLPLR